MKIYILPFLAIMLFTACSDSNAGVTRLEGTAAVGAPLVGSVFLKNTDGTVLNTTTDANGRYLIPEGHGYPALLMVEGRANGTGPLVQLYSWATGPGNLNLTPATHAIVSLALQDDPRTIIPAAVMKAAGAPLAAAFTNLNERTTQAAARMGQLLSPLLAVTVGDFDLLHGHFQANGQGFDLFLDCIHISVTGNLITLTNAVNNTLITTLTNTINDLTNPDNFTSAIAAISTHTVPLTNQLGDTVAPYICPTNTEMRVLAYSSNYISIEWPHSFDNVTDWRSLKYKVYYSLSGSIMTNPAAGGTVLRDWTTALYQCVHTNVVPDTQYYFNVIVKDLAGNQTIYHGLSQRSLPAPDTTPPIPGDGLGYTNLSAHLVHLVWGSATDNATPDAVLEYKLVTAPFSWLIDTVAGADSFTNIIREWHTCATTTFMYTNANNTSTQYLGLLVRDAAGNKALYPLLEWNP